MKYDFDTVSDRKNTDSLKHDCHSVFGKRENLIPLWVADMDFKTPIEVEEALVKRARHGIFGYSEPGSGYFEAVKNWFSDRFNYNVKYEWLLLSPGVVFALAVAIRAFSKEGDAIMIQRPVYHIFTEIIRDNNRKLVNNALIYNADNNRYYVDFEDFERKIRENRVKLFILCSPHNPVGRVWGRDELEKMGDICLRHGCTVLSDEIHCDFVYAPHKHQVFSTIKPDYAEHSIIFTAPSKTFNLPGLQTANIFAPNPTHREKFAEEYKKLGYGHLNPMGLTSCESAYLYGHEWLSQLIEYLVGNMKLVYDFGDKTGIKPVTLEGTYLSWLNFSPLGLKSDPKIDALISEKAGLWLSNGTVFGYPEGSGFQRINIACPRNILSQALELLLNAVKNL